ncbi:transcription-repair coupling factor [Luteococcus sp.]|uniref:transcription-repair coupling factor n=1 Tax=Luteococcus sp. TaxID=1969402 RepID=UPI003734C10E
MTLTGLSDLLSHDPVLSRVIAESPGTSSLDLVAPASARAALAATLQRQLGRTVLVVTSTYREAEQLTAELESWTGSDQVAYFPAWETLPHERLSPRSDTVGRRLAVLRRLAGKDTAPMPSIVVAPVRSVLQPQVKGLAELRPVRVVTGQEYDTSQLVDDLVGAAYSRVDLVERRGEFAVRGGIVDIFPPTLEHPVRIDFFGDEVDEIRHFTVADQRSMPGALPEVVADPCRELLLDETVRERARTLLPQHPELAEMLEKISEGQAVEGMEALTPVLVDGLELLLDVLPADCVVLVSDPELVRTRAHDLTRTSQEFLKASWAAAAGGGAAPVDLGASAYWELADVRAHALSRGQSWWSLSGFSSGPAGQDPVETEDGQVIDLQHLEHAGVAGRQLDWKVTENHRGDTEGAVEEIRRAVTAGSAVVLSVEGKGLASRLHEVLGEREIGSHVVDALAAEPEKGTVTIVTSTQRHGFVVPGLGLAVFTAGDLAGKSSVGRAERKMPSRRKNQISPLELKAGDAVVHEQHGVGRYVEMVSRTVAGSTREYLVIEYAASKRGQPGDRLFVPMDQLDLVTRYVGGEAPTLDKMGGSDWNKRKSRARKAVKQIAAELIKLYAARQATRGHAFSPDTAWQRELEDAFAHVETPDQLACINEVKHDMEQVVPMDRLICGDVGYGKTEIAVRAAFKAVQDGKQVAVLVPTTLLVTQHYNTFSERYAGFPVRVAQLSRFQSDKEAREVIDGVASGKIDIVVGTHRLFGGKVQFKDLGLVVIDEEQRFGVEHKESLKKLRLNVDVLAMSATPIPRTLEMAITGIREMSVIATPPEERHPVLTFAGPYDQAQVVAAVRRELAREGQVFYVHNRVQSIDKTAAKLRELVPEARIVTAHGQMSESQLEGVMQDFWERRADVLVSTTIVEAGIDISTANTLLIERADLMGLSQLHQLRGRVGRGRERGYAYFLYPPDKPLTETAHDRLATMAANTDLGAGMKIAMRDLEIRGAGNLLGGEQSGHIADVGFDLYIRLVGEAVADYRGDSSSEAEPAMRIELPVDANLPDDYVGSERLRLEMYKRLAEVRSVEDIVEVRDELLDRYGPLPGPTQVLLEVARFRLLCRSAGVTEVVGQGNNIRFSPFDVPESRELRLNRLHPGSVIKRQAGFVLIPRPTTAPVVGSNVIGHELLEWATRVVVDIFGATPLPELDATHQ